MFWLIDPTFGNAAGICTSRQHWNSCLHYVSCGGDLAVGLSLTKLQGASVAPCERSLTLRRCWSPNLPTNDHDLNQPGAHDPTCARLRPPGIRSTDVNAAGSLCFYMTVCSVRVFFLLCFVDRGKPSNPGIKNSRRAGYEVAYAHAHLQGQRRQRKEQDLASNPRSAEGFQQMTKDLALPRLDIE